jgi:hypothetical protein
MRTRVNINRKLPMDDQDFPTVTTIMLAITVMLIIVLAVIALW